MSCEKFGYQRVGDSTVILKVKLLEVYFTLKNGCGCDAPHPIEAYDFFTREPTDTLPASDDLYFYNEHDAFYGIRARYGDVSGVVEHKDAWGSDGTLHLSNGKLHREDGPAIIGFYPSGAKAVEEWFQNGIEYRDKVEYNEDGTERKDITTTPFDDFLKTEGEESYQKDFKISSYLLHRISCCSGDWYGVNL